MAHRPVVASEGWALRRSDSCVMRYGARMRKLTGLWGHVESAGSVGDNRGSVSRCCSSIRGHSDSANEQATFGFSPRPSWSTCRRFARLFLLLVRLTAR